MNSSRWFFPSGFRTVVADKNDFLITFLYYNFDKSDNHMLHCGIKENKMTATENNLGSKLVHFKWTISKIWFSWAIAQKNSQNWGYSPWTDQFSFLSVPLDVVARGQFEVTKKKYKLARIRCKTAKQEKDPPCLAQGGRLNGRFYTNSHKSMHSEV